MFQFLKILARNLIQGPATEAFPLKPAETPARFRGKVKLDKDKCIGCGICRHVCTGEAIRIEVNEDKSGYEFSVWHNTCCLCGSCRHYCPTKAITLSNDWHNAHEQKDKYNWADHYFVPYLKCSKCSASIRMFPPELATRIYYNTSVDMTEIIKLCPSCRQVETAEREGDAQHAGAEHK